MPNGGRRYVFPNQKTFKTWFSDFSSVIVISDAEMAAIPLAGNVTYKPGVRMVKIQTDPKVYALARGGLLRWVMNEAVAVRLYGPEWNTLIDDVSDAFFVNYAVGESSNDAPRTKRPLTGPLWLLHLINGFRVDHVIPEAPAGLSGIHIRLRFARLGDWRALKRRLAALT